MSPETSKEVSARIGDGGESTDGDELNRSNRTWKQPANEIILDRRINKPTSARASFRHKPLTLSSGSIRLVEILSPSPEGTLRCRTRTSNIDFAGYTCLSYVWGSVENLKKIMVDGQPFQVTRNLHDFLATAARSKSPRADNSLLNMITQSLWIDAICIDQSDLTERSHQVQQMGRVYSQARQVISWLGDSPEIVRLFKYAREASFYGEVPSLLRHHLQDMACFGENEYWTRAWITQETCLAKRLYFLANSEMAGLEILQELEDGIERECDPDTYNRLWRPLKYIQRGLQSRNLLENLWQSRRKHCKEPRDLVYSLLSISQNLDIVVDYATSLATLAIKAIPFYTCFCGAEMAFRALRVSMHDLPQKDATSSLLAFNGKTVSRTSKGCPSCCNFLDIDGAFSLFENDGPIYGFCITCFHLTNIVSNRSFRGHLLFGRKAGSSHLPGERTLLWAPPDACHISSHHELRVGRGTEFYHLKHDYGGMSMKVIMSTELVLYIMSQAPMDDERLDENIENFRSWKHPVNSGVSKCSSVSIM